jgi:hypothetical protein
MLTVAEPPSAQIMRWSNVTDVKKRLSEPQDLPAPDEKPTGDRNSTGFGPDMAPKCAFL